MAVITLTSGIGTGAKHLAELVSRKLGLALAYRDISVANSVLPGANNPCQHSSAPARWERGLARLEQVAHGPGLAELEDIYRLARRNHVLICGATPLHFLADIEQVIKIRVRTTMALRVRRMMSFMDTENPEPALERILAGDQRQAATLFTLFDITNYEEPSLYDLVVDTGRDSVERIAEQIAVLARADRYSLGTECTRALDERIETVRALRDALLGKETKILTQRRASPGGLNGPPSHHCNLNPS